MIDPVFSATALSAGKLFAERAAQPAADPTVTASSTASFADTLSNIGRTTVDTLEQAETMSIKALTQGADTRAVADAVMSAEQSLQAAIALRDKVVTAYLELSRMAI